MFEDKFECKKILTLAYILKHIHAATSLPTILPGGFPITLGGHGGI